MNRGTVRMRARMSVVIPTLNSAAALPDCLSALHAGVPAGLVREVIVSDGGSGDATCRIADDAGARIVAGPASRGGQLRRGCAAARGEWLLVVHADTVLSPGWVELAGAHMARSEAGPPCFRLAFRARGMMPRWVAGWANLRTRLFGLPYGDQGLLVRRSDYDRAGGYPDQPLMEDVALARALGGRFTLLEAQAVTGAERYLRDGWLKRGGRNLWTLARYFAGVPPERLARSYHE